MRILIRCLILGMLSLLVDCSSDDLLRSCSQGTTACGERCIASSLTCDDPATYLDDLLTSAGFFSPVFLPDKLVYTLQIPVWIDAITLTPFARTPTARVLINGTEVGSGSSSVAIATKTFVTMISVVVQVSGAQDRSYSVAVMRSTVDYLKASNSYRGDLFGSAVSVSGDTLAVGTAMEASSSTGVNGNQTNRSAPNSGAVYVFVRTGYAWTQQAYIKASNAEREDGFGYSVALYGDTLAIGAYAEDGGATGVNGNQADNTIVDSGAVYVFVRTGNTWTQQAYLKASNRGMKDLFGSTVSLWGDTLAVGAEFEASGATGVNGNQADDSLPHAGAVYVFVRNGSTWTQQAYLKASNTGDDDRFGSAVSLWGDTLAVGAWAEDSSATGINQNQANDTAVDSGAVYVFVRTGTAWAQQAYLKASNTDAKDEFGAAVSLWGDTLAVGASGEASGATGVNAKQTNNAAAFSGAAYVFTRVSGTWAQQAYLKASNTRTDNAFGSTVSLWKNSLVVGAPRETSNGIGLNGSQTQDGVSATGAAYFFTFTGSTWTQQIYLKSFNRPLNHIFGAALALSEGTLVIGAPYESGSSTGVNGNASDQSALYSGAAYVYAF